MKYFMFVLCLSWFIGLNAQSYEIILETDFDGLVTKGSKVELIQQVRDGKSLRVGWQLDFDGDQKADLEHWIEATFITILGGELFTQIDPIYAQGPNLEIPQVEIFPDDTRWTAIIGTNGQLLNRFIQNGSDKQELVFDNDLNLSEADKDKIRAQEAERISQMKQVATWPVATFWAVLK